MPCNFLPFRPCFDGSIYRFGYRAWSSIAWEQKETVDGRAP